MGYSVKNPLLLTRPESFRYLKDKKFREKMQKKAGFDKKSGRYLISLFLSTTYIYVDEKGVEHCVTSFGDDLTDVSNAANVCEVDLSGQVYLRDITPLSNVGVVDLTCCFELCDFGAVSGPGRLLILNNCQSDQEEELREAMARGTTVVTDM
jgi:hypothetical protein